MAVIRDRVMSGKMRYRDAAVACFDLEESADALRRAAGLYGVPLFLESGRGADRNPLAQFALLALRLVAGNWQAEDMERLMRTGYTALTPDEADRMADCAVEQGLRGALWKKPLHRYRDERDAALEPLRQKLVAPLAAFEEAFSAAPDTRAQLAALWDLLERVNARETLRALQARCAKLGLVEAANENAQAWNRLVTTLDQLASLMEGARLTARDLCELLSQSLAASDIKPLPQSGDAVMAGSLSHLRGGGVDILFVMGCCERRAPAPGGLFQTHERELLGGEKGVWLAPDQSDRARLAAIDLASTLAMARKFVVFTWPQSDAEGAAVQPGAVVGRLRAVFPELSDSGGFGGEVNTEKLLLNAPDAALARLSAQISAGQLTDAARGAMAALYETERGREAIGGLREAAKTRAFSGDIDRLTARRLYGGPRSVSVTRLERYAACPFRHFVQYGLRPVELEPYELKKTDEGSFYHEALEDFLKNAGESLAGLSAEEAISRMDDVSERLLAPMMDGPLSDNPVMLAYSRRMRAVARRAARTVTKHLSGSRFTPCALEVRFDEYAPAVTLHTGLGDVPLKGRIDRIDEWRDEDETWLRVIDYKSGQSELNLSRLYFGLQLQLIVYLAVALGRGDARPAGAFYFKVADPIVESESRDPDVIEGERMRELRLSGLYIDDQAVLSAMSPGVENIVSLRLKQDGSPAASPAMVNEDGFDLLIRHALKAAASLAEGILAGKTAI
ncbi:MAG: PD-(D/E)XK nuclease family protein, partial [Clostridia bacterium]|nr:PD-(D/E)XK nuclease family protein [Clostridia bacterium]